MADPASASLLLLVAIVALVLPVAYWVLRPLVVGELPVSPPDPKAVALLSEREAALASLRDLDADLRDGRIGAESHADMRAVMVERAAQVLEALDRLGEQREGQSAALADDLERQVLAASERLGRDETKGEARSEALSEGIPSRAILDYEAAQPATRGCADCGYRSKADARFCGGCGRAFEDEPA